MSTPVKRRLDFSIIIPTYNRSEFLKLAISSVLRQKGVSFEIIVGDDYSADDTKKTVQSFHDKRIKYYKNSRNLNTALNFKKCFSRCSGDYIFTLSDDDFILDPDTLVAIRRVMHRYDLGMGKIGTITYESSPQIPYQISVLSDTLKIVTPNTTKDILVNTIDFGLGFFSGLTFNNTYVDSKQLTVGHRCKPGHLCGIYHPVMYDLITRRGIGYIPDHFIVSRLSTELMANYFKVGRDGWFFMENHIALTRKYTNNEEYKLFTNVFLRKQMILLPNIKYFTNTQSYIRVLRKMITLDDSLKYNPLFILFAFLGFMPNVVIRWIRKIKIYFLKKDTKRIVQKYNYGKRLEGIEFNKV